MKLIYLLVLILMSCSGGDSSPTESNEEQLPIVFNMNVDVSKGHSTRIPLRCSYCTDRDYNIIENPTSGNASIIYNNGPKAKVWYINNNSSSATQDSLTYQVSSGDLNSNIATMIMNIYQFRILDNNYNGNTFNDVINTSDGGYITVGSSFVIKFDNLFNQ